MHDRCRRSLAARQTRRRDRCAVARHPRRSGGAGTPAARRRGRTDPEISAFLVPINPEAPGGCVPSPRIKYVRTVVTELIYLPTLVRELRRADVVHVFSASYWSFLLAPLPAVIIARLLGRPVLVNYRSGEAPDHLRRSAIARGDAAVGRSERRAVAFPAGWSSPSTRSPREIIPNIIDRDGFASGCAIPCGRDCSPRATSKRSTTSTCTLRAFAAVQRRYPDATLTLVGGRLPRTLRCDGSWLSSGCVG